MGSRRGLAAGSLSGREGHLLCLCQPDVPCAGGEARHQRGTSAERKGGRAGLRLWRFFRRTHQYGCSADGSERRGTAGDHRFLAGSQSEDRPVLVGCGKGGNAGIQDWKATGDRQAGVRVLFRYALDAASFWKKAGVSEAEIAAEPLRKDEPDL